MGHIKDIANQPKLQTFPSSTFEIVGDVPAAQCSDFKIEGNEGYTLEANDQEFYSPGTFVGYNLIGKNLTIFPPAQNAGGYAITNNGDDVLFVNPFLVHHEAHMIFGVHNGGELLLTRDLESFAAFIHAAGYAYTIKGGKLYTNIPSAQLQPACSIIFDPLT